MADVIEFKPFYPYRQDPVYVFTAENAEPGRYVRWSDYDALLTEVEQLKEEDKFATDQMELAAQKHLSNLAEIATIRASLEQADTELAEAKRQIEILEAAVDWGNHANEAMTHNLKKERADLAAAVEVLRKICDTDTVLTLSLYSFHS